MKYEWMIGVAAILALLLTGCGAAGDSAVSATEAASYQKVQPETVMSYEGGTYMSANDDENALCLSGGKAVLEDITVQKTGGVATDVGVGDISGSNAAVLAKNCVDVTVEHAIISSTAQSGSGIFCTGEGTKATIYNSVVTTSGDYAGGLQITEGGVITASGLTVKTSGNVSAAIRAVRGSGLLTVSGGKYTTSGFTSPAVYSTGEITVENAVLTANNSEALVLEGQNSLVLKNCTVTGNMSKTDGVSVTENVQNVMIYQSETGISEEGTALFSMTGGSLTALSGDMFYITNVPCCLYLTGVELLSEEEGSLLMQVSGNSGEQGWGEPGSNGAQVEMIVEAQTLAGDVEVDNISTWQLHLLAGSSWVGAVSIVPNAQGGVAADDNVIVNIAEGCVWSLTGDSQVSVLENAGTIQFNGYTVILADGTVLKEE